MNEGRPGYGSRVRKLNEYELTRCIEADLIKMRQLGQTPQTLAYDFEAGIACHHEREVWDRYRTNVWLLTGDVLTSDLL